VPLEHLVPICRADLGLDQLILARAGAVAEEWERDASLRLRAGDKTTLDAHAEHGRILGGSRKKPST